MHPSDSSATDTFSPCTQQDVCGMMSIIGTCLKDSIDLKTVQSSICGNGVKEGNEECDCGSPEECASNPCCQPGTCKLKEGKQCDDSNDACCSQCMLKV